MRALGQAYPGIRVLVAFVLLLTFSLAPVPAAQAATLTVCPTGCDYASIQAAIDAAANDDTISIGPGTYLENITVGKDLTILGAGADSTIVDGSQDSNPPLVITFATHADVSGIAIMHGFGDPGGGVRNSGTLTITDSIVKNNQSTNGGGIYNDGTLTIANSTVQDNFSEDYAGGIRNQGTLTILNSTIRQNKGHAGGGGIVNTSILTVNMSAISGNTAYDGSGGGLLLFASGSTLISHSTISGNNASDMGGGIFKTGGILTIVNSTISGNSTPDSGGGIMNIGTIILTNSTISSNTAQDPYQPAYGYGGGIVSTGTLNVTNTIIAKNIAPTTPNCSNVLTSYGHNLEDGNSCGFTGPGDLINTDPLLGPLQNNGGPTLTHALQPGSPAIDAGDTAACTAPPVNGLDQRGEIRPQGMACDIGAYESGPPPTPPTLHPAQILGGIWARTGTETQIDLGSFEDADSDGPWTVAVDWGDGSPHTTFSVAHVGPIGSRPHTYEYATTFSGTVSVTDQAGLIGERELVVEGYYLAPSYVRTLPIPKPVSLGLAYTNGSLWASSTNLGNTSTIFELDPATGAVRRSFPSPTAGIGLATDGTLLYITTSYSTSYCGDPNPNQIIVIDPATEQVVRSIPNPVVEQVGGLTYLYGHLYAIGIPADSLCDGISYQNYQIKIVEIDPSNGAILHEFPVQRMNSDFPHDLDTDGTNILQAAWTDNDRTNWSLYTHGPDGIDIKSDVMFYCQYCEGYRIFNPQSFAWGDGQLFVATPLGIRVFDVPAINTPPGNNVVASAGNGTTVTFASVATPGTTSVTSSTSEPPVPAGFTLGASSIYYDIRTTASYAAPLQVCLTYDPSQYSDLSSIRLLHYENGAWADVTSSNDLGNHIVCGTTSSLSPFVVVQSKYRFSGFFRPVDNMPVINLAKAGSAIPVKFSIGGNMGLSIFDPGYPKSQVIGCDSAAPLDGIEETVATNVSGLSYDPSTGQYIYVWKTNKTWAGACRQLVVKLNDLSYHRAIFMFTK
jgi:hypothetical protein